MLDGGEAMRHAATEQQKLFVKNMDLKKLLQAIFTF